METETYYLQQAADMERFAGMACSVAEYDAFLMVAENCRTLAREAARAKQSHPISFTLSSSKGEMIEA